MYIKHNGPTQACSAWHGDEVVEERSACMPACPNLCITDVFQKKHTSTFHIIFVAI